MIAEIYRPMEANGDRLPKLGLGCKKLGIREQEIVLNEDSMVIDKNGLSVATSLNGVTKLPKFLLPFEAGGRLLPLTVSEKRDTSLFQFRSEEYEPFSLDKAISCDLKLNAKAHKKELSYVSPNKPMPVDKFKAAVDETQDKWSLCDWETVADSVNELNGY